MFESILLDKSNFSIYTLHVTEIRIPFAGTRNRENLWYQKSSNWKRSIGGDIESWIFLPLSGNLAICHGISHVRGIGRRREGRILELRTLRAGGVQVRSNLELDYLVRRPDPFALILARVTEFNSIISCCRHYDRAFKTVIRLFLIPLNWIRSYFD